MTKKKKSFADQLNPALAFLSVPAPEPMPAIQTTADESAPIPATPSAGAPQKRIQILLPADLCDQLRAEATRAGASVSELIRSAIRAQYPEEEPKPVKENSKEGENVKTLTIPELREILQVSLPTIYNLIRAGKLKAVKCGRAWRVTEEELRRYLTGSEA